MYRAAGPKRRGPRAARPAAAPALRQARARWPPRRTRSGPGTSPSSRARQVDLLLPVRDPRHLQPLRRGLDGRRRARAPALAERLIEETCAKQGIAPGQLTIHADRGAPMISKTGGPAAGRPRHRQEPQPTARLQRQPLLRGPVQDRSSTAPRFPTASVDSSTRARSSARFFAWYNTSITTAGSSSSRPPSVHHGRAGEVLDAGATAPAWPPTLAHPERFVNGPPQRESLPPAVWINPPEKTTHQDALRIDDRRPGRP